MLSRAELHQLLNLQRIQRLNDMEARLAEVNELRVQVRISCQYFSIALINCC